MKRNPYPVRSYTDQEVDKFFKLDVQSSLAKEEEKKSQKILKDPSTGEKRFVMKRKLTDHL